ncbi:hypothetical protein V6N13_127018 [Hibiscus sabdariffa]|uniref:Uncharacterized protein n=1 Tax=Hibiscus sabdariffa TaxID=183260 RepID=A0ABR2RE21_9ROSI
MYCVPNNNNAYAGGAIRAHTGMWIQGFAGNLGKCTVEEADAWGVEIGSLVLKTRTNMKHPYTVAVNELLERDWEVEMKTSWVFMFFYPQIQSFARKSS